MQKWEPGEPLTYYPEDECLSDDRGTTVADVHLKAFGEFAEASAKLAEWLDNHPDEFYEAMAGIRGPKFDEMFRRMMGIRGLVAMKQPQ